mgnify:CR=1 FL=1
MRDIKIRHIVLPATEEMSKTFTAENNFSRINDTNISLVQ